MSIINPKIACFITPHGFGHAARICAVMAEIQQRYPQTSFEIFTTVPEWFFYQSNVKNFNYHPVINDIGIIQSNPFDEDLKSTVEALNALLPFPSEIIYPVANELVRSKCQVALCDISPLGIAAAEFAHIPSILEENFTWDWIYDGYLEEEPLLKPYIELLHEIFASSTYRIQTTPCCNLLANANLLSQPVSRSPQHSRSAVRKRLGLPDHTPAVLITLGGIPPTINFLQELKKQNTTCFIVPGATKDQKIIEDNLVLLPHHSEFYHPDLINAVDAVVGKAGYSTVAETYHAGLPYEFISRRNFREAPFLAEFIKNHMPGFELSETEFNTFKWIDSIPLLLQQSKINRNERNGSIEIADFITPLLQ